MALKNYDSGPGPGTLLNGDHATKFPTLPGRSYPRQGTLYIQANSKKEAAEKLTRLGYPWMKPRDLRLGMGDALDAMVEAGLLDTGDVFIVADWDLVVRVSQTDGKAEFIGKVKSKPVFIPAEEK